MLRSGVAGQHRAGHSQPVITLRRRAALLAGVVVLASAGAIAVWQPWQPATPAAAPPAPSTSAAAPDQSAAYLAADGVRSDWVLTENQRPGTTKWKITGAPATGGIAGFADVTYAQVGQNVTFYVNSSAPSFHVEAYRVGYYQGNGARLVWQSGVESGQQQPACPVAPGTNMVACDNWSPSFTLRIPSDFPQGDYLFKLVGAFNEQSYVPLTIWQPDSHGTYLIKNDVFTWQAWNPYGGYDYYQGVGSCPARVYPLCSRARVVSYDRPYDFADAGGQGTGDFLWLEAPLVRFMEQHGLDVSYATDVTVAEHPNSLGNHKVLLSLGHDECWSLQERQAAVAAYQKGMNLAFFGASAVLRHVRTQASPMGADREAVDYRDSTQDPLNGKGNPLEVTGNTWTSPPAGWSETPFVGESYNGFLEPKVTKDLTVVNAGSWIFRGTGLANGAGVPNAIGSDVDSLAGNDTYPPDVEVLAHSTLPVNQAQANTRQGGNFFSDMTYYSDPASGAGVWDSGTNNWIPALTPCANQAGCPAAGVRQMTTNLMLLFGQGPAGKISPSTGNRAQFYPNRS
jgi:hypothetical protein